MQEHHTTWEDLRRIADELQVQLHLAGMEARERWRALEPRISALEASLARTGAQVGTAIADELAAVTRAARELRDDLRTPNNN